MNERLSYTGAGVDIDEADAAKREMARSIDSKDSRVLNKLGAFASLVEGTFPDIADPILVLKTEEPGSKQKLAFESDRLESLCRDTIHHLLNDVAVMGARPCYVLDCIVCGRLEKDVVARLVTGMADGARDQGCVLVGGETSIQPGVVPEGVYVLSATAIGVVDRAAIVDGSSIQPGDVVLAVASNGLHTNGYTLVRALLDRHPALRDAPIDGDTFFDVIMRPHICYVLAMRRLFDRPVVHGLAHITGGGVRDNLVRILPAGVDARITLNLFRPQSIFRAIREHGAVEDEDMLRTFNMGCGLVAVCDASAGRAVAAHFEEQGHPCWQIGEIVTGSGKVSMTGEIPW